MHNFNYLDMLRSPVSESSSLSPLEKFLTKFSESVASLEKDQTFTVELDLDGCFVHGKIPYCDPDHVINQELLQCLKHIKTLVEAKEAKFQVNICSTADLITSAEEAKIFHPDAVVNYFGQDCETVEDIRKAICKELCELNGGNVSQVMNDKGFVASLTLNENGKFLCAEEFHGKKLSNSKGGLNKEEVVFHSILKRCNNTNIGNEASRTLFIDNDIKYHKKLFDRNEIDPTRDVTKNVISLCPISAIVGIESEGKCHVPKAVENSEKLNYEKNSETKLSKVERRSYNHYNQDYPYDPTSQVDLVDLAKELELKVNAISTPETTPTTKSAECLKIASQIELPNRP